MIGLSRLKQLLPVLVCFAAVAVQGQIGMNLTLNRTAYMQYEPVYACVTLRNDSGRPLVFGEDPRLQGFLLFEITDSKGRLVPKRTGQGRHLPGECVHLPQHASGRVSEQHRAV